MKKTILFIINKAAGTGYLSDMEKMIMATAQQNSADCTIEFTRHPGHAVELSRLAVNGGFDQVVAVGGDGTTNEVAQGLVHTTTPMGIVPAGSGNGLGRHLGISMNTAKAIDQVFKSEVLRMDTFTINGRLSLNVSGIGFDGHITNLFGVKGKRGLLGYVKIVWNEFFNYGEFGASVTVDDKKLDRTAFIIAIANSSQYGNNARIAPKASVTDGLLHMNIVRKIPLYRADFVYQFFTGSLENSAYCEIIPLQHLQLKTKHPVAFHVDGEPAGSSDTFDIKLHPHSLSVLVPLDGGDRKR